MAKRSLEEKEVAKAAPRKEKKAKQSTSKKGEKASKSQDEVSAPAFSLFGGNATTELDDVFSKGVSYQSGNHARPRT